MSIIISLLPVLLFLAFIIYLDSFKLVRKTDLIICFVGGAAVSLTAYYVNNIFLSLFKINFSIYSRYIAPFIEEFLKCLPLLYLIYKNRIGFMIDAAILGFTIGTGFSLIENLYYLSTLQSEVITVWIVRGFGTAIMHGGSIAIFGIFTLKVSEKLNIKFMTAGFFAAVVIHSIYNHFIVEPILTAFIMFFCFPVVIVLIFQKNESSLRKWLEIEFDTEVRILKMIKDGQFKGTKTGKYIIGIKNRFASEVVVDILCYIRIYIELSLRAKSNLLLKESGFPVKKDSEIDNKMMELKFLQKNIGKTGLLTISPVLRMSKKNIWKLNHLG